MKISLLVFTLALTVFVITGWQNHTRYHFFVPLAKGFLNGRLYVDQMTHELHEMVDEQEIKTGVFTAPVDGSYGKYYVIFPPVPAVLLMPVVLFLGEATNQSHFSALLAALSVVIAYQVFVQLLQNKTKSVVLAMVYAFGSMLWYHAIIGSAWYYSQVCGLLFLWIAILAVIKKKQLWLVGMFAGLAYLSRYSLLLSFPFFVYVSMDQWFTHKKIKWQQLTALCASFAFMVIVSLAYNWVRYDRLGHYGYTLLEQRPYNLQHEYSQGSYSLSYAGRNMKAMLWSFPRPSNSFPYLTPNTWSMALWFAFPAIFICFTAARKYTIVRASWLTIFLILPTSLFHGGVGATQFGYRYALDYLPFLFILIAMAVKTKLTWWQLVLFTMSIVINTWGVLS